MRRPISTPSKQTKNSSIQKVPSAIVSASEEKQQCQKKSIVTPVHSPTMRQSEAIHVESSPNETEQNTPASLCKLYDVSPPKLVGLSEDEPGSSLKTDSDCVSKNMAIRNSAFLSLPPPAMSSSSSYSCTNDPSIKNSMHPPKVTTTLVASTKPRPDPFTVGDGNLESLSSLDLQKSLLQEHFVASFALNEKEHSLCSLNDKYQHRSILRDPGTSKTFDYANDAVLSRTSSIPTRLVIKTFTNRNFKCIFENLSSIEYGFDPVPDQAHSCHTAPSRILAVYSECETQGKHVNFKLVQNPVLSTPLCIATKENTKVSGNISLDPRERSGSGTSELKFQLNWCFDHKPYRQTTNAVLQSIPKKSTNGDDSSEPDMECPMRSWLGRLHNQRRDHKVFTSQANVCDGQNKEAGDKVCGDLSYFKELKLIDFNPIKITLDGNQLHSHCNFRQIPRESHEPCEKKDDKLQQRSRKSGVTESHNDYNEPESQESSKLSPSLSHSSHLSPNVRRWSWHSHGARRGQDNSGNLAEHTEQPSAHNYSYRSPGRSNDISPVHLDIQAYDDRTEVAVQLLPENGRPEFGMNGPELAQRPDLANVDVIVRASLIRQPRSVADPVGSQQDQTRGHSLNVASGTFHGVVGRRSATPLSITLPVSERTGRNSTSSMHERKDLDQHSMNSKNTIPISQTTINKQSISAATPRISTAQSIPPHAYIQEVFVEVGSNPNYPGTTNQPDRLSSIHVRSPSQLRFSLRRLVPYDVPGAPNSPMHPTTESEIGEGFSIFSGPDVWTSHPDPQMAYEVILEHQTTDGQHIPISPNYETESQQMMKPETGNLDKPNKTHLSVENGLRVPPLQSTAVDEPNSVDTSFLSSHMSHSDQISSHSAESVIATNDQRPELNIDCLKSLDSPQHGQAAEQVVDFLILRCLEYVLRVSPKWLERRTMFAEAGSE
ncbi:unnamed protein product [Echinostoma caproni]|uniref:Protein kinase domain-containing protein n=1 Tax=Echinostoma caproni TaxID=27848 RepID=A0A183AF67_9TREM|nr:unnamed protein product [Echinostoma caproni]